MQNNSVVKILQDLVIYFGADRAVIAEIHAQDYTDLKAYDKVFSITTEYLKNDTPSIKNIVYNIPIKILEKEKTYYKDNILIVNKNNKDLPLNCRLHLNNIGCEVILNCLLRFSKIIIGVLSIQFVKSELKSSACLSNQDIEVLKIATNTLSKFI